MSTLPRALVAFVPVSALVLWSVTLFLRARTLGAVVQLLGAGSLLVVVLAHFCEALHLVPWMHWGEPHSAGHYLDLWSAIAGLSLFSSGFLIRRREGKRFDS